MLTLICIAGVLSVVVFVVEYKQSKRDQLRVMNDVRARMVRR